jgi:purine-binding chemotaxis protein CheW
MSRECITFEVGGQTFALDIGVIREIRGWAPVTRVPGMPAYVAGVATLNGAILPVIDLAVRLGWEATLAGEQHSILIVQIGNRTCGMVVAAVGDLVMIEQASLLAPPPLGGTGALRFIEGLAPSGSHMVQVLDIEALAGGEMMSTLHSA